MDDRYEENDIEINGYITTEYEDGYSRSVEKMVTGVKIVKRDDDIGVGYIFIINEDENNSNRVRKIHVEVKNKEKLVSFEEKFINQSILSITEEFINGKEVKLFSSEESSGKNNDVEIDFDVLERNGVSVGTDIISNYDEIKKFVQFFDNSKKFPYLRRKKQDSNKYKPNLRGYDGINKVVNSLRENQRTMNSSMKY